MFIGKSYQKEGGQRKNTLYNSNTRHRENTQLLKVWRSNWSGLDPGYSGNSAAMSAQQRRRGWAPTWAAATPPTHRHKWKRSEVWNKSVFHCAQHGHVEQSCFICSSSSPSAVPCFALVILHHQRKHSEHQDGNSRRRNTIGFLLLGFGR